MMCVSCYNYSTWKLLAWWLYIQSVLSCRCNFAMNWYKICEVSKMWSESSGCVAVLMVYQILLYACAVRLLVWITKFNRYVVTCGRELWGPTVYFISDVQLNVFLCLCSTCDFIYTAWRWRYMIVETYCSKLWNKIDDKRCANCINYCVSIVSGVTLLCIRSVVLHVAGAGRCEHAVQEQEGQGAAEGDCKEV